MQADLHTGLYVEIAAYNRLIRTADRIEGIGAYNGKRQPFSTDVELRWQPTCDGPLDQLWVRLRQLYAAPDEATSTRSVVRDNP
ncbi:hypothetical protein [Paraburkholderia lycopersici]|uniref:Uncharacterized protein n=1 Tax=Paraburkholderia lycopersici TaxID=416944 RepID=A0A1G6ZN76_9BURK|nr:hypothetical protein [Paraburkholderia lycopersici]SDE04029.1 hypothetical protein SAMN05421548_13117 [Paraburkholderia lycopersici]